MSTYRCQVCSTVDERKTRRHEDIKMMQRRHKTIATPQRKASSAPKKTVRWNKGCDDLKTWNQHHKDNRQWLKEQFSKRRSVSDGQAVKLKLAFTSPNVISTCPQNFWWAELISHFFCKLNSSKCLTCPSAKLRTKFTSPIAKSTNLLSLQAEATCAFFQNSSTKDWLQT